MSRGRPSSTARATSSDDGCVRGLPTPVSGSSTTYGSASGASTLSTSCDDSEASVYSGADEASSDSCAKPASGQRKGAAATPREGPVRGRKSRKSKVSHARAAPPGHIKRPPNAFFLFRSHFCDPAQLPSAPPVPDIAEVARMGINDHSQISRIVGALWGGMADEQKQYWYDLADAKKAEHQALFPDYKFRPGTRLKPEEMRHRRDRPSGPEYQQKQRQQTLQIARGLVATSEASTPATSGWNTAASSTCASPVPTRSLAEIYSVPPELNCGDSGAPTQSPRRVRRRPRAVTTSSRQSSSAIKAKPARPRSAPPTEHNNELPAPGPKEGNALALETCTLPPLPDMHHDPAQYDHHVSSTGAPSATVFRMPFARESTGSSHALLPSFPLDGLVIDGRRLSAEDSVTTFAQSNAASFKFSQPPSHLQGHELTLVAPPDAMPHDHRLSSASYWGVHQLDETQGDAGDWPADAGVFAFNRDFFEATQDEQHVHLGEYEYSDSASARTHSRAGTASTSDSSWSPLVGRQQLHGPAESVADAGHSWPHSLASSPLPSPLDPMPDAAVSEPFHIGSSAFFTTPSSAIDTTPNLGMTATPMPTSIATMSGDAATGPLSIPVLSSANLAAAEAFHSQSEAVSLPPATSPFGSWTPPPALSHLGLTDAQRIRGSDATVRPLGRQGSIAHSLMSRPSDAGLPGSQRYSRQRLPSRAFLDCIETGLLEHEGEPESPQAISQEPTYLFLSPDQAHNAQLVQQILNAGFGVTYDSEQACESATTQPSA